MERIPFTRAGLARVKSELEQLENVERPSNIRAIEEARAHGDISENAEYHAAKEAQVHLERKIAELEDKLRRVQTVDADQIPTDKAYLFSKVKVKDLDHGEEIEYTLSPPDEADIDNDVISVKSPIGAGLLGKAVGEVAEIKIPVGTLRYEILSISRD